MEHITKTQITDRHFDFSCSYHEGRPEYGFEFFIHNKKNNKVRAKVKLDDKQLLELQNSIHRCLGDKGTE